MARAGFFILMLEIVFLKLQFYYNLFILYMILYIIEIDAELTSELLSIRQTSISSISFLIFISDDSELDVTDPEGISGVLPLDPKSEF